MLSSLVRSKYSADPQVGKTIEFVCHGRTHFSASIDNQLVISDAIVFP
jgi:hypothetical protein